MTGCADARRGDRRLITIVRAIAVTAVAVALASCSAVTSSEHFSERETGVSASPRVASRGKMPDGGGRYMVGKPYRVAGKTYVPRDNPGYSAVGYASWYGKAFHGRRTANGEVYDMADLSAAHPTLPLPSYVRVTNLANGRSIVVRVNDRGPFKRDRIIDVSASVAEILDFKRAGVTKVKVEYAGLADMDGRDNRMLMASYRGPGQRSGGDVLVASRPVAAPKVMLASAPTPRPAPAVGFGAAGPLDITPAFGPASTSEDPLGPLILRTGFASSYAPPAHAFTPAHAAAAKLAAAGSQAALVYNGPAIAGPRIVQIGTFSNPENAERAGVLFAKFGRVVTVERLSGGATLHSVRVVIDDPALGPAAVIAAAEAAGLSGAFLVSN